MTLNFSLQRRRLLTLAAATILAIFILACGSTGAETPSEQTSTPVETVAPQPATASPSQTAPPRRTPDPEDSGPGLVAALTFLVISEGSLVLEAGVDYTAEEIYFDSFNDGDEAHNLAVVSWDGDPAGLPVDSSGRVITAGILAEAGHGEGAADFGELGASDYAIYEVEPIAPGNYVIFCSIPGHYGDGEYAPFTVHAPAADAAHHHLAPSS